MVKRGFLALGLMLAVLACIGLPEGLSAEKELINGFDAAYPPFSFVDKSGKPAGFDIDAIDWIAKEMNLKVRHQPTDWAAIVPSLNAKKIDFIASGMSITPERQAAVNFVEPYWTVVQILVVKKDSNLTVEDCLKDGAKVGVLRGSAEYKWITENMLKKGKKFELRPYDTTPLAVEDVANGRVESAALSNTAAKESIARGVPVKILGGYGQPDVNYGYAVRKEDADLLKTLNDGLKKLKATPYWGELVKKWALR
jgi:polar amino acid transport system substrate-binding protein